MDANRILEQLKAYGYTTPEGVDDTAIITFMIDEVNLYIKHFCNICVVPECLEYVIIDMVCGKFLQLKKNTGQLTQIQLDGVLKAVRDGDTQVEYNVSYQVEPEAQFVVFIDKLIKGHNEMLLRHRRLAW